MNMEINDCGNVSYQCFIMFARMDKLENFFGDKH